MIEMNENPWAVTGSKAFIFYCCPECEFKEESEKRFIWHAVKNHERVSTYQSRKTIFNTSLIKDLCFIF